MNFLSFLLVGFLTTLAAQVQDKCRPMQVNNTSIPVSVTFRAPFAGGTSVWHQGGSWHGQNLHIDKDLCAVDFKVSGIGIGDITTSGEGIPFLSPGNFVVSYIGYDDGGYGNYIELTQAIVNPEPNLQTMINLLGYSNGVFQSKTGFTIRAHVFELKNQTGVKGWTDCFRG